MGTPVLLGRILALVTLVQMEQQDQRGPRGVLAKQRVVVILQAQAVLVAMYGIRVSVNVFITHAVL